MINEAKPVFTAYETAEYLGMSLNRIYDLCKTKDFPVMKIGRRKYIPKEKLDEWINENVGKTVALYPEEPWER
ncbi:MAG: helix-turn-helix domain-containing protein [Anaerovoracaceae bacterium]